MKKMRVILYCAALFITVAAVFIGNVNIPFEALHDIVGGKDGVYKEIILSLRLPRVIGSFAAGSALAVCGVVIQSIIRNPLGEPYMLGISSGAALGAVIGLVAGGGAAVYGLSFVAALITSAAIYVLSVERGEVSTVRLILTGVVINFLLSSVIMLILTFNSGKIREYFFWTMGDFGNSTLPVALTIIILAIIFSIIVYFFGEELDLIAVGEESAFYTGVNVEQIKKIMFVLVSAMTAVIVSANGVIGFVGIIIPHILKLVFREKHKNLIVDSFFAGGVFLAVCDTIGRSAVSGAEIPVGIITSIVGAPVFLHIMKKNGGAR